MPVCAEENVRVACIGRVLHKTPFPHRQWAWERATDSQGSSKAGAKEVKKKQSEGTKYRDHGEPRHNSRDEA